MARLNLVFGCIFVFFGCTSGQGGSFNWTSEDEKYMVSIGDLKTWEEAFENCITMNRTLVTIQDETEHFEVLAAGRVERTSFCSFRVMEKIVEVYDIPYITYNMWNLCIR